MGSSETMKDNAYLMSKDLILEIQENNNTTSRGFAVCFWGWGCMVEWDSASCGVAGGNVGRWMVAARGEGAGSIRLLNMSKIV